MSSKDKWYDSDDPERIVRGAAWFSGKWILLILALCIVGSVAGWAINTAVSGPAGKAGAYRQKQSTDNRLFAQANFEDRYNTIASDIFAVKTNFEALKADKANTATVAEQLTIDQENLTGSMQACAAAAADYNADSGKYLLRDFKSAGLPQNIDLAVCDRLDDPARTKLPERTDQP